MSAPDRNLIFDIGMHVGQDTEFYLKKGFCVIAVEANPKLTDAARARFAPAIAEGRLVIRNAAMAQQSGTTDFNVCNGQSEWSSLDPDLAGRSSEIERIAVPAVTYTDLAKEYGTPYYMKIDIEGVDLYPIMDLSRVSMRPAYVSYEATYFAGAAYLLALGYRKFKLVGQRDIPALPQPADTREGPGVSHPFPLGSSGPFGEETPGDWSSFDDCASDYALYKHFRRLDKRQRSEWADIHARSDRFAPYFEDGNDKVAAVS